MHTKVNEYGILTYNFAGDLHKAGGLGSHSVPVEYKDKSFFSSDMHRSGEIRNLRHIYKVPNPMRPVQQWGVKSQAAYSSDHNSDRYGAQLQFISTDNLAVGEENSFVMPFMDKLANTHSTDISYTKFIYGFAGVGNSADHVHSVLVQDSDYNFLWASAAPDQVSSQLINTYRDPSDNDIDLAAISGVPSSVGINYNESFALYKISHSGSSITYTTNSTGYYNFDNEGSYLNTDYLHNRLYKISATTKKETIKKVITGPGNPLIYYTDGRFAPLIYQDGIPVLQLPIVYEHSKSPYSYRHVIWDYTKPDTESYLYNINTDTIVCNAGAWAAIRNDGYLVTWGNTSYGAGWESVHTEDMLHTHYESGDFSTLITNRKTGGIKGAVPTSCIGNCLKIFAMSTGFAILRTGGRVAIIGTWSAWRGSYGGNIYSEFETANSVSSQSQNYLSGFVSTQSAYTEQLYNPLNILHQQQSKYVVHVVPNGNAFALLNADGTVNTVGSLKHGGRLYYYKTEDIDTEPYYEGYDLNQTYSCGFVNTEYYYSKWEDYHTLYNNRFYWWDVNTQGTPPQTTDSLRYYPNNPQLGNYTTLPGTASLNMNTFFIRSFIRNHNYI
jgi:hypothetical protein